MKTASIGLVIFGIAFLAFAYWGLETRQGRLSFDEMDGMIPFFFGIAGAAFLFLAVILTVFRSWYRGR